MSTMTRAPYRISIRKTGASSWPWEARCTCIQRFDEEVYVTKKHGVVAFNTRGVGNRTWTMALAAAARHVKRRHRG